MIVDVFKYLHCVQFIFETVSRMMTQNTRSMITWKKNYGKWNSKKIRKYVWFCWFILWDFSIKLPSNFVFVANRAEYSPYSPYRHTHCTAIHCNLTEPLQVSLFLYRFTNIFSFSAHKQYVVYLLCNKITGFFNTFCVAYWIYRISYIKKFRTNIIWKKSSNSHCNFFLYWHLLFMGWYRKHIYEW